MCVCQSGRAIYLLSAQSVFNFFSFSEIRNQKMIILAQNNNFEYFNINKALCIYKNFCEIYDTNNNMFIFTDGSGHLSLFGIRKIKFYFFEYLNTLIE